jgi:uncharacterized membrane protein YphA (DoxX/SURF4 family)
MTRQIRPDVDGKRVATVQDATVGVRDGRVSQANASDMDGWALAGIVATPLRWVTGWLFFSAFWRRAVLAPAKLDPTSPLWNGKKINDFLPHSLGIGNMLEWLVTHPDMLQVFLLGFTVVEALVGLALLLGLATRFAALATAVLSFGILLGAGWIGTTCLDEWQIGAAGIAGSFTVLLAGAGPWSLDRLWTRRFPRAALRPLARLAATGPLGRDGRLGAVTRSAAALAVTALLITLATNQVFAGGVWGPLHNDSKAPHLTLSNVALTPTGDVSLRVYRDGGPDTYGAFIISATVVDAAGATVEVFDAQALSTLPRTAMTNYYINKVVPGGHALVVPLAAKADLRLAPTSPVGLSSGSYKIVLTDVSGMSWTTTARVP